MLREDGEIRRFFSQFSPGRGFGNFHLDSNVLDKWKFSPHYWINYLELNLIFFFPSEKK
jgi:hypothetical protein